MNTTLTQEQTAPELNSKKQALSEPVFISDDCWGGELYHRLRRGYTSPTIGLWIGSHTYLRYLCQFDQIHTHKLIFIDTNFDYPVATLCGVMIGFMHSLDKEEAEQTYWRRFKRINNNKIFTKIDFGKPGYTLDHIEIWNSLKIPNSVALYPEEMDMPGEKVHNGVAIPNWDLDGAKMFKISAEHFDVDQWVESGRVTKHP